MCDTLVAMGGATKNGHVLFAKNSDREPNEPQVLLRIPRRHYDLNANSKLKTTYIEIDQVEETNEIVISKPSWMWGCEMGVNEYAVAIGNEAVFTKEPYGKPALTGMDMIRLALERTKTAKEAKDCIIALLDRYGQGGNCGYTHQMHYHNSFIIADPSEAYVLETAGQYWVTRRIDDFYAISNGLTIETDFDDSYSGPGGNGSHLNFKKRFSEPIHTTFSSCRTRQALSMALLGENKGSITADTMIDALRRHRRDGVFRNGSMQDLCMHAGSVISSQTTASLVGELKNGGTFWYTGSSLPCISVFKPFIFSSDFELFSENNQEKGVAFWTKRETIHRMLMTGQLDETEYIKARDEVQSKIFELYYSADLSDASREETGAMLRKCLEIDERFTDRMLKEGLSAKPRGLGGSPYFRRYWAKENAALKGNL